DCPFPRVQSKKFCRSGGNKLDEAVGGKSFSVDAASVNQAETVLDARPAVGNFREVVLAEFFLFLQAEGAMVGGNHLQSVLRQPLPEFFLVPFLAQRRRENVFRAFES